MAVELGDTPNEAYLLAVVKEKLIPAAKQILQTGVAPDGAKPERGKEAIKAYTQRKMTVALETYKEDALVRFRYPSAYAKLVSDGPGREKKYIFKGAFTAESASDVTLEAVFAMLATRQALAGSQFLYPMTLFLGPTIARGLPTEDGKLGRFSRVVFGSLASEKPYTAMVSYTFAYPRRAYAVVWIPGEEEGPAGSPGDVGSRVTEWWKAQGGEELANAKVLKKTGKSEFIRSTGSKDQHSLLWPIIKLSMTTDESKLYAPLGTASALGGWKRDDDEIGFYSDPWHQWAMGLLAYGSIPYKKHSRVDPDPWYGQHMERTMLNKLVGEVQISPKEA